MLDFKKFQKMFYAPFQTLCYFIIKTNKQGPKSKASRAIMASSEENIDFKKLLYWKQSSVANPAIVGGGYRVWIHPPKL